MKTQKYFIGSMPVILLLLLFITTAMLLPNTAFCQVYILSGNIAGDIYTTKAIVSDSSVGAIVLSGKEVELVSKQRITLKRGFHASCENDTKLTVKRNHNLHSFSSLSDVNAFLNGTSITSGDVVILNDGGYIAAIDSSDTITFPNTLANCTLRAETEGGVIITGNGAKITISGQNNLVSSFKFDSIANQPIIEFSNAHFGKLSDCVFDRCGDTVTKQGVTSYDDYPVVQMRNGTQNSIICNNYFTQLKAKAIDIRFYTDASNVDTTNKYNTIRYNCFFNITSTISGVNGCEIVQLGQSRGLDLCKGYNVVEYNLFDSTTSDAEIISVKTSNNIVRYNTITNSGSCQIVLRLGINNRVESNYMFNSGGIRILGDNHQVFNNYLFCDEGSEYYSGAIELASGAWNYNSAPGGYFPQVRFCTISNNTIINSSHTGLLLAYAYNNEIDTAHNDEIRNLLPSDNNIYNNLVQSGANGYMYAQVYSCANSNNWDSNYAKNTSGAASGIGAPYVSIISGSISLFNESNDNIWHINTDTLNGRNLDFILDDFESQIRDSIPDIGCDEYSISPITRTPLDSSSVGPSWLIVEGVHFKSTFIDEDDTNKDINWEEFKDNSNSEVLEPTLSYYNHALNINIIVEGNYTVDLYNTLGQKIKWYKINPSFIGTTRIENIQLYKGIYIVNLINGNELVKSQKIVVF